LFKADKNASIVMFDEFDKIFDAFVWWLKRTMFLILFNHIFDLIDRIYINSLYQFTATLRVQLDLGLFKTKGEN